MAEKKEVNVGDCIKFGRYAQEEIRWQILEQRDDELLIISEKCLDTKPYHTQFENVIWETCILRCYRIKEIAATTPNSDGCY